MAHQVLTTAFRSTHRRHAMATTRTFSVQTPSTVALTVTSVPLLATAVTGMETATIVLTARNHQFPGRNTLVSRMDEGQGLYRCGTMLRICKRDEELDENNVVKLRHELDEVQKALNKNPSSNVNRDEEAFNLTAYTQALLDEERFLKEKAKIELLRVGDSNSAYFHRSVKARVSRSRIECGTGHDNIILLYRKETHSNGNMRINRPINRLIMFLHYSNSSYKTN
ncbi:hypothetical protein Tco_1546917 [Tanacetum coccineum]